MRMTRICPRCGGVLVPVKKDGEIILKCPKCGYEETSNNKKGYEYRIQIDDSKRIITSQPTEMKETKITPEERDLLNEYYDILLEELEKEETGESD